jgi:hypothetical protein
MEAASPSIDVCEDFFLRTFRSVSTSWPSVAVLRMALASAASIFSARGFFLAVDLAGRVVLPLTGKVDSMLDIVVSSQLSRVVPVPMASGLAVRKRLQCRFFIARS